ncbi:set domain protein [Lasallia pustulata]|uniref:Histone-lysine N-methyltransferase SET9 n=1 Tax=Lasallia pustulata TaxID=136370 RepID=A0A1W5D3Y6_9LECA|nr:set domain protein [Lasallia pustulata]
MSPLKEAIAKKERLTLTQLASYDDILTDTLVDHVYFWTTIRKNRSKYNLTRGISEDSVTSILLHDLIVGKDPQKAEKSLLKLPGLRKFVERLKTDREKEDFRRHMRKYINIWLPDCPWEVSTVNRYTIVTQEAATTARRAIRKGDTIKYLSGNLVAMTPEEEKDLDLTRRDFSIVMSSRKRTPSLFLGPARFANHDCNANARLVTSGTEGMQVIAVRDIDVDEEITVTYGEDYFGLQNCECLCRSCELEGRNGWAKRGRSGTPSGTSTPILEDEIKPEGPYSFRRKRKYGSLPGMSTPSVTPEAQEEPMKRRKLGPSALGLEVSGLAQFERPIVKLEEPNADVLISLAARDGSRRSFINGSGGLGSNQETKLATRPVISSITPNSTSSGSQADQDVSFKVATFLSQSKGPVELSQYATPRSIELDSPRVSQPSSDAESLFDTKASQKSSSVTTPSASQEPYPEPVIKESTAASDQESDLSDLSDNEELDDLLQTVVRRPRKRKPAAASKPHLIPTIELSLPHARHPGDYIRTPLLLGEAYSRWVDCGTCDACWVQSNGYYTRKECPRCERHSKLYGFQWPKTERLGRGDEEVRVLDHRTVHRFLRPEEEARVEAHL